MTASPGTVPPPTDSRAGGAEVAELAYSSIDSRRPWLVSGIGITSIVVASLSLLGAVYSGLMLIPMLMFTTGAVAGGGGMTTVTTPPNTITAPEADVIVAALNSQATLSPADQKLLAAALVASEVPFAPPADGKWTPAHVTGQISGYSISNYSGTSYTSFDLNSGGDISLSSGTASFSYWDANGNYVNTTYGPNGASTSSNAFAGSIGPEFSKLGIATQIASFVLSLGLAALLLIAGIQTVRGVPSGRKLHLWWAWPKMLAAVLGAAAWYFWFNQFLGGFGPGGAASNPAIFVAIGSFAVAIIWPITVLILLRARSVRAYYADA